MARPVIRSPLALGGPAHPSEGCWRRSVAREGRKRSTGNDDAVGGHTRGPNGFTWNQSRDRPLQPDSHCLPMVSIHRCQWGVRRRAGGCWGGDHRFGGQFLVARSGGGSGPAAAGGRTRRAAPLASGRGPGVAPVLTPVRGCESGSDHFWGPPAWSVGHVGGRGGLAPAPRVGAQRVHRASGGCRVVGSGPGRRATDWAGGNDWRQRWLGVGAFRGSGCHRGWGRWSWMQRRRVRAGGRGSPGRVHGYRVRTG